MTTNANPIDDNKMAKPDEKIFTTEMKVSMGYFGNKVDLVKFTNRI